MILKADLVNLSTYIARSDILCTLNHGKICSSLTGL